MQSQNLPPFPGNLMSLFIIVTTRNKQKFTIIFGGRYSLLKLNICYVYSLILEADINIRPHGSLFIQMYLMSFSGNFDLLCLSQVFTIEIRLCADVIFTQGSGFCQILPGQYLTGRDTEVCSSCMDCANPEACMTSTSMVLVNRTVLMIIAFCSSRCTSVTCKIVAIDPSHHYLLMRYSLFISGK